MQPPQKRPRDGEKAPRLFTTEEMRSLLKNAVSSADERQAKQLEAMAANPSSPVAQLGLHLMDKAAVSREVERIHKGSSDQAMILLESGRSVADVTRSLEYARLQNRTALNSMGHGLMSVAQTMNELDLRNQELSTRMGLLYEKYVALQTEKATLVAQLDQKDRMLTQYKTIENKGNSHVLSSLTLAQQLVLRETLARHETNYDSMVRDELAETVKSMAIQSAAKGRDHVISSFQLSSRWEAYVSDLKAVHDKYALALKDEIAQRLAGAGRRKV